MGLIYRFRANTCALSQAAVQRYFLDRRHGLYRDAMIVITMLPLILNLISGSTGEQGGTEPPWETPGVGKPHRIAWGNPGVPPTPGVTQGCTNARVMIENVAN